QTTRPVTAVTVPSAKGKGVAAFSHVPHDGLGARIPKTKSLCLLVYEAPDAKGRVSLATFVVPHPRITRAACNWRRSMPGAEALPAGAKVLHKLRLGDLLRLPMTPDGKVADSGAVAYAHLWGRVSAIKTDGAVRFLPAEY